MRLGVDSFDSLAAHVGYCLENIQHPNCTMQHAGRFYEEAAEALRCHAILRLLIDANPQGFASDLVMSGHARRAWLKRCRASHYEDGFLALARTGSMFDALAADEVALAGEIFAHSPEAWRRGDEYEDDFRYQRYLGLRLSGASDAACAAELDRFDVAAESAGARLAVCQALQLRDSPAFAKAFAALLDERSAEIAEDGARAEEELNVAIEAQVFVEGVALLKLARRLGVEVAVEYPMCPALALLPGVHASPPDEFTLA